jgi:chromosome segregation ATPase
MREPNEERFARPELRYRKIGGGYRRKDVESALEQLLAALHGLDRDLGQLRERAAALEQELHAVRAELEAYRAREAEIEWLLQEAEQALDRAAAAGAPTMIARGDG